MNDFDSFDTNRDGSLSFAEVREGLRRRGIAVSAVQLETVFNELDVDGDARITRSEFEQFCVKRRSEIKRVFHEFDRNKDGKVSSDELRKGVEKAGLKISDTQLRVAFEFLDENGDGSLSFAEFEKVLTLLPRGVNAAAAFDAFVHRAFVDDAESEYTVARDWNASRSDTFTSELVQKLLSGGFAGAISRTATAPIDRVKTILQSGRLPSGVEGGAVSTTKSTTTSQVAKHVTERIRSSKSASSSTVNKLVNNPPTLRQSIRFIYREGGAFAFWRGNGANVLKVVPETAVKFAAFDALKQLVAVDPGNATTSERFVAGGIAGAAAQAVIYPLEIVKTRMALSSSVSAGKSSASSMGGSNNTRTSSSVTSSSGSGDSRTTTNGTTAAKTTPRPPTITGTLSAVLNESGPRGLFRGLTPSLVGIVPYAGIDLMTNSSLRESVTRRYQHLGIEPGIPELLGCGMASSTTAMLATYPLNVVRTRMQTGGLPGFPSYTSVQQCLRHILKTDGIPGFYRGIVPSLAKVLPASSISYAVYDILSTGKSREE